MPFGEYPYAVDDKGRVIVPPPFRTFVEHGMIITRGMEKCLYVFPITAWSQVVKQLEELPMTDLKSRKFLRYFYSGAANAKLDGAGRITLPSTLRDFADLESSVMVAGAPNHLEIWNEARWKTTIEAMHDDLDAPELLQGMVG